MLRTENMKHNDVNCLPDKSAIFYFWFNIHVNNVPDVAVKFKLDYDVLCSKMHLLSSAHDVCIYL